MRQALAALVGALALVAAGPLAPVQAADTSITPEQVKAGFSGGAYGSYVFNSDKSLTSGPTANSAVSCTASTGRISNKTLAEISVPSVGKIGAAATSVKTLLSTNGKRIESVSSVSGANLLGGLITAGTITSESSSEKNTAGAFSGTNHTTIDSLKVLGVPIGANPAANRVIDLNLPLLGSLGKVTLNGQEKRMVSGTYQVTTTALRVQILKAGIAGVKAGTDIRMGVSTAKLTPPQAGYLTGTGFSTKAVTSSGLIASGPTASASAKCDGGTSTSTVAAVSIPGLAAAGTASTTTTGVLAPAPKSIVSNTLAGLNVLNGVIQADAIKAETTASKPAEGGKVTFTDTSSFTNLRIAGLPTINANVAPNTVIQVSGLGSVTLHKVTKSSTIIAVTMIEIVLNQPLGALPTGSKIQIGYSSAGITP